MSSPEKVITKFVMSPHSYSCILDAITIILAAGCYTSNSFMTVAASDVTKILSKWFITIFFIPFGPKDVLVMFEMSLHAWIFFKIASSTPP